MPDNNGNIHTRQIIDVGEMLQSIKMGNIEKSKISRPNNAFLLAARDHFTNKDELKIINDPTNRGKKILLRKESPICDHEVIDIDFCDTSSLPSNLQDTTKFYGLPLDEFKVFKTPHISFTENSWRDLAASGGIDAMPMAIQEKMIAGFRTVMSKIDKWIGDSIYAHQGCYPDGSNTTKSINLFFTEQNGQRTLNAQAFDDIERADELDENKPPYKIKIGGTVLGYSEKILARTVPNTAIGIDQRVGVAERIKQTYMSKKITEIGNDGAEKIFNIDPRSVKLLNYVDESVWSGGINTLSAFGNNNDLQAWDNYIINAKLLIEEGALNMFRSFLYFDDMYGFRWQGKIKVNQCDGKFNFVLQFFTNLALEFTNKGDLSCTNRCATGIEVYNVCVPDPQPSCAPTTMPVLPPSLCAYVTMPTPCNYTIAKGDTLTLDFGGMTYEYVMPYTLVFEDTDSVLANIQSMFGNYIEKGRFVQDGGTKQWLYIEPFQSGTTSNALTVGTGKISASCFAAEIGFELRNCDAAVTRKIETRGVEQPTKADPASFINTALAKSTVTATKTTVTSTKANPSK